MTGVYSILGSMASCRGLQCVKVRSMFRVCVAVLTVILCSVHLNSASELLEVDRAADQFYAEYKKNKLEKDDANIPPGAASLAFVFDITGSMYDDLVQVIAGAAKILATTLARREQPLYNYVLVPFHDPGKYKEALEI